MVLFVIILTAFLRPAAAQAPSAEKEVSFKTADGWTISGMLSAPKGSRKLPAVLFLHAFAHDREAYGQYLYPGLAQIIGAKDVATLRIDLRGRGRSRGAKELHSFSAEELSKVYLDVRAALKFLAEQETIDSSRLAIVAEEESADAAVLGGAGDPRVKAITLVSGRLSDAAKKRIATSRSALLLILSKEDREGFRDMATAYNLSRNPRSRIWVFSDLGIATTMFSVWRSEHPKEEPIEEGISRWMLEQIGSGDQRDAAPVQSQKRGARDRQMNGNSSAGKSAAPKSQR